MPSPFKLQEKAEKPPTIDEVYEREMARRLAADRARLQKAAEKSQGCSTLLVLGVLFLVLICLSHQRARI